MVEGAAAPLAREEKAAGKSSSYDLNLPEKVEV